jgi:electron transport complex protein RnfG
MSASAPRREAIANAGRAALVLGAFALAGAALLTWTERATRPRIEANAKAALEQELNRLVPAGDYDNDLLASATALVAPELTGVATPVTLYRATKAGRPVAALFEVTAPDGYSGAIRLLVAVQVDGRLAGARVLVHKETPGLGDYIEERRSDWIHGFDDRSLTDPEESLWAVRKDGGAFDHVTGATVTPRAIVKALRRALVYCRAHPELFLSPLPASRGEA